MSILDCSPPLVHAALALVPGPQTTNHGANSTGAVTHAYRAELDVHQRHHVTLC